MAKVKGRPISIPNSTSISMKMNAEEFQRLRDIASLESLVTGTVITAHQLIRDAISWVYSDNERLRELFRNKKHYYKRFKKKSLDT